MSNNTNKYPSDQNTTKAACGTEAAKDGNTTMKQAPGRDHIPGTVTPASTDAAGCCKTGEVKQRMGEGACADKSARKSEDGTNPKSNVPHGQDRKDGQSQPARKGDTGADVAANLGKSDHKGEDRIEVSSKNDADKNAQKQNQPQPKAVDSKPKH